MPTTSVPARAAARASSMPAAHRPSRSRATGSSASPCPVSAIPLGTRSNNPNPSCRSSTLICLDRAGCYAFNELRANAEPRLVRRYAERSLRNLGTDVIDLYYAHYPDPGVPIEETVGAMAGLVRDGLIRHVGLSNVTAAQLRAAHAVHPVAAVQNEWSMWRHVDPDLLATTRELGVGIVAWSPLGSGFLTGTVQSLGEGDFRHNAPRFDAGNLASNNDRCTPIRAMAAQLGITPAQLALAWLLHQDEHVVTIPGSRTPSHIEENLAAADLTLHPDTLDAIGKALAAFEVSGGTLL
ncbi:aldo/keto reductase [Nonomuraea sp. KC401]|nr:hypothetical protein [Nonomuraea sp. K271]TLF75011.1 aldo/keto reductase [Nonomuraea sp. KC401]